jgi:transcriptional regulator with XRE-family HTH domain
MRMAQIDYQAVGHRLRVARERQGLSQEEVAERLGMSAVGYGHYERG